MCWPASNICAAVFLPATSCFRPTERRGRHKSDFQTPSFSLMSSPTFCGIDERARMLDEPPARRDRIVTSSRLGLRHPARRACGASHQVWRSAYCVAFALAIEITGSNIYLKSEHQQFTGSFRMECPNAPLLTMQTMGWSRLCGSTTANIILPH